VDLSAFHATQGRRLVNPPNYQIYDPIAVSVLPAGSKEAAFALIDKSSQFDPIWA
jgi:hypothetical protein